MPSDIGLLAAFARAGVSDEKLQMLARAMEIRKSLEYVLRVPRLSLHPVIAVFAEELGRDQWIVRYEDEEGQMGWFHRKQNPGTGAMIDTPIHGETTIVLTDAAGETIGHIVFREGAPPEMPRFERSEFPASTVPGQSGSDSETSLPFPGTESGATTSSPGQTPGSQSGAGSLEPDFGATEPGTPGTP